ncbi:hypothetical protein XYCOK13_28070 [Xylanibacillus composti]|uniref:HAD family hydrolase n=1 Tax=Xylanibacillus composti TaxID=1572762 RepID=A0A8J4H743_9BACL|nr:HAD hydrolase-like protein [Xylanibacillus composti]GIQ69983.1 hypothetical protein XYCOK13_28070 [Xylanibacillus composti]
MDGTLYDELEFIKQVYQPISMELAKYCLDCRYQIYDWILQRWMEKGSSYNKIFDELLDQYAIPPSIKSIIIDRCLDIYRHFDPKLTLPVDVEQLLDKIASTYNVFLVSDGPAYLQMNKFTSLQLHRWFDEKQAVITGKYGREYYKPSILSVDKIPILRGVCGNKVVYFGDREVDRQFAMRAGFQFVAVSCMQRKVQ